MSPDVTLGGMVDIFRMDDASYGSIVGAYIGDGDTTAIPRHIYQSCHALKDRKDQVVHRSQPTSELS